MATEQKHRILAPAPRRPIPLLNPRRSRHTTKSLYLDAPPLPPPPIPIDTTDNDDKQSTPTRKRMVALREEAEAIDLGSPVAHTSAVSPLLPRSSRSPLSHHLDGGHASKLVSSHTEGAQTNDVTRRSASAPLRRGSGTSDASSGLLTAPNSPLHLRNASLVPRTPKPLHTMAGKAVCSPIPRDWTANPLARVHCLNSLGVWPGTAAAAAAAKLFVPNDTIQVMEEQVVDEVEENQFAV